MDPTILIKLLVVGVIFIAVLRAGVFAWDRLGKYSTPILSLATLVSMLMLYPFLNMASLFDQSVLPSFIVLHTCGGMIVCSVIAKWVENKAKQDLAREATQKTHSEN